ncbi:MAG: Mur ligase family protein [Candidatus Humimicrobiaceae bacterium]
MNFRQVSKYLDDCLIFGIKPSLVRIKKILELLGNPHKKKDFIHVVGTNGKTSTTAMAASIMHGQGISCGYHISPHIGSYTERFWSNGRNISEKEFSSIFNKLYPYIQKVNKLELGGPITQFEILTAMSFLFAEEKDLDVMVMEAGMGGRWDATNIADSLVVGFTGVSLEHTQILGNSITDIAKEKVEVIKEGAEVAVLSKDKKVLEVLKKKVASTGSRLYLQGKDFFIENMKDKGFGYRLDLKGIKER